MTHTSISNNNCYQYRITFFGDSICVGQGVSLFDSWVNLLAREIDSLSTEAKREILITNSSVNGRTTRQALEDMPYHIQSQGVDIILIQFGLNDCNYWQTDRGCPRVSLESFIANIKEIIHRSRTFGASTIIMNNNHPTLRDLDIMPYTNKTFEQSNREYNKAMRTFAQMEGKNIIFCDIEKKFNDFLIENKNISLDDLLLKDGLHLSKAGHAVYYDNLKPILTDILINKNIIKKME